MPCYPVLQTWLKAYAARVQGTNTSSVDMHGALFSPTWTRLAATAYNGTSSVTLQAPVNWLAGQLVAVTTSIWKDECRNQASCTRALLHLRACGSRVDARAERHDSNMYGVTQTSLYVCLAALRTRSGSSPACQRMGAR
jgi:hypothetical protein